MSTLNPILNPRVIVIGVSGQVGFHLQAVLNHEAVFLDRAQINLNNIDLCIKSLDACLFQYSRSVRWLVLAAAYTQVDLAETFAEEALRVNGEAPGVLGLWAKKNNIKFIYYSTDYVFNGLGILPFKEEDAHEPINVYGKSKSMGEKQLVKSGCYGFCLRTSWVYSEHGKNFVKTILKLLKEREKPLTIIQDQVGAPTYALDLALATKFLIHKVDAVSLSKGQSYFLNNECFQTYHFTNQGEISWYDFACAIKAEALSLGLPINRDLDIQPIFSHQYKTAAQRPMNSRLSLKKWQNHFPEFPIQPWKQQLQKCMRLLCN